MEFSEASENSMTAMENNGEENGSSYDNGYNGKFLKISFCK